MSGVHLNNSNNRQRNIMITDLDESDNDILGRLGHYQDKSCLSSKEELHRKVLKKKRTVPEKNLVTFSGNFSRRSRSAECKGPQKQLQTLNDGFDSKEHVRSTRNNIQTYFNELLKSKEQQMDKLLLRLGTVHKFNEQFAEENSKLQIQVNHLNEKLKTLRKQLTNCDNCKQLSLRLDESVSASKSQESDITMMKTLVYRLNVQIENYQDLLRLKNEKNSNNAGISKLPSQQEMEQRSSIVTWSSANLQTHTLTPLLNAYDETIREKEELLAQYKHEFEHFTGELKQILEENNRLLQVNDTMKLEVDTWREEKTRLKAQVEVCRTKAEAQTKKSDLAKEKLVEVMHCYEQKLQALSLDLEHVQSAYTRCKTELSSLKCQPTDTLATSLQECMKLLEQLKEEHAREKRTLERNLADKCESHVEVKNSLEKLKVEHTTLKRDFDKKTGEFEEMHTKNLGLQREVGRIKRSRDRLKTRLRIALQWAKKLEEGQANIQSTWDALKRLETIVKHKESQVRGMHDRHVREIGKLERQLASKEETIRSILKGKLAAAPVA